MLDKGAQINIIKKSIVPMNVEIATEFKVILKGITEDPVPTLGALAMVIHGQSAVFHVAPDHINIPFDGMLGNPFFFEGKCKIDYEKGVVVIRGRGVPFRMENEVMEPITEISSSDCYSVNVKKVNFDSDLDIISSAESSVTGSDDEGEPNDDSGLKFLNKVLMKDNEVTLQHVLKHQSTLFPDSLEIDGDYNYQGEDKDYLSVKTIHSLWSIQQVEEDENYVYLKDFQESIENDPNLEGQIYYYGSEDEEKEYNFNEGLSRTEKLKTLLCLDHLNTEERKHIEELFDEFAESFFLEGDELGWTDEYLHRIQLHHDQPIFVKQYRIPYSL